LVKPSLPLQWCYSQQTVNYWIILFNDGGDEIFNCKNDNIRRGTQKNVIDAKLRCDVLASLPVKLCHYLRSYIMPLGKTKSAVISGPKQGACCVKAGSAELLWAKVNKSWWPRTTKFCTAVPNICESTECNFFYVKPYKPRTFNLLLDFMKICGTIFT
jgi:hypothetical protein